MTELKGLHIPDSNKQFAFDITRSFILSNVIPYWGNTDVREVFYKAESRIEVYSFPPIGDGRFHRFLTCGISNHVNSSGICFNFELFFIAQKDFGEKWCSEIFSYLASLATDFVTQDRPAEVGLTLSTLKIVPKEWKLKFVVLDDLRGEPEELDEIQLPNYPVKLFWVMPIFESEQHLISKEGMEAFDTAFNNQDWLIFDMQRPSII